MVLRLSVEELWRGPYKLHVEFTFHGIFQEGDDKKVRKGNVTVIVQVSMSLVLGSKGGT